MADYAQHERKEKKMPVFRIGDVVRFKAGREQHGARPYMVCGVMCPAGGSGPPAGDQTPGYTLSFCTYRGHGWVENEETTAREDELELLMAAPSAEAE